MKNYRTSLFTIILSLCISVAFAQNEPFSQGDFSISGGVGFPNTTHAAIDAGNQLFNLDGEDSGSSTPFYNVNGTYAFTDQFAGGLYFGYFKSDSEMIATGNTIITALNALGADINLNQSFGNTSYSVFSLGGKLEVHEPIFRNIEKLDTYASTYLGYNIVNDDFDAIDFVDADESEFDIPIVGSININNLLQTAISEANYPTLMYEVNAGARYAVGEQVSIFGEAGIGRFLVNTGITYHVE